MPVQALNHIDPREFFTLPSTDGTGPQRLNTQVSGVAVSNDLSGRLSVTTAEGDTITLTADLEYDFRAVNYASQIGTDRTSVSLGARYTEAVLKTEFGVTVEGELNEQELSDLGKLFRKVSTIFRSFFHGNDEAGLAKTATLAERLGQLPSLSGLDLSVDIHRSVTVLAAQIASEVTGQQSLPTGQESQTPSTSSADTPGGAPRTEAVIPPLSTGLAVPTSASSAAGSVEGIHVSAPAQEGQSLSSLVQQVLDALRDAKAETRTVRKYLPDFLEKLREDLVKELRGEREHERTHHDESTNPMQTPATTSSSVIFAYQSMQQTAVALSIQS